jgi:hypothetical protein
MESCKPEHFKQPTPADQLTVIRMSLGWAADGYDLGLIDGDRLAMEVKKRVADLRSLGHFVGGCNWELSQKG